jgi:hypothetical protein
MENRVGSKLGITVQAGRQGSLICKGAGFQANLEAEYVSRGDARSIHLDAFTALHIEPESSQNLKWHLDQATSLRDFAALCFGAPLPLQSISFWGGKISISETIQIPEVVSAYFFEQTPSTPSQVWYPIIMFRRLEHVAPEILSVWCSQRAKYQEVIELIFLALYGHHTRPEVGFLLAVQAFEAFDRAAFPRNLTSAEHFKTVFEAIVSAIPQGTSSDLRQKMKDSIQYANEPSLRKRLKDFQGRLHRELGPDPLGFKLPYIDGIVVTRNYLTHYPEELKQKILTLEKMVEETDRFCIMLILCVLKELGLPFDETIRGVHLHSRFRRFSKTSASRRVCVNAGH